MFGRLFYALWSHIRRVSLENDRSARWPPEASRSASENLTC